MLGACATLAMCANLLTYFLGVKPSNLQVLLALYLGSPWLQSLPMSPFVLHHWVKRLTNPPSPTEVDAFVDLVYKYVWKASSNCHKVTSLSLSLSLSLSSCFWFWSPLPLNQKISSSILSNGSHGLMIQDLLHFSIKILHDQVRGPLYWFVPSRVF